MTLLYPVLKEKQTFVLNPSHVYNTVNVDMLPLLHFQTSSTRTLLRVVKCSHIYQLIIFLLL